MQANAYLNLWRVEVDQLFRDKQQYLAQIIRDPMDKTIEQTQLALRKAALKADYKARQLWRHIRKQANKL